MSRAFDNLDLICLCCGKERKLVNKFHRLCGECNTARLNENKKEKDSELLFNKKVLEKGLFTSITAKPKSTGLFEKKKESKSQTMIDKDEKFYEECFNLSDHKCEECGDPLPDTFRDDNGKVIARYRYSHIIPKSIAPELRHDTSNINHLCMKHHQDWDFGDRRAMKIFEENSRRFPNFFIEL